MEGGGKMRRTALRPISKKRAELAPDYNKLVKKLRILCGNASELDGTFADWQTAFCVEPHHIDGRSGNKLIDPFGIVMLTRTQHDIEEGKLPGQRHTKEELKAMVRPLRLKQGFKVP